MSDPSVSDWVDRLQSRGRYTFTRDELLSAVSGGTGAVQAALRRLKKKGRVVSPRKEFYVIVPLEHQPAGAPPPSWFVDDLMSFVGQPYYVGLLTAAAIHGAAHQRPQEFQIVTDRPIRDRTVGRGRLRFFTRKEVEEADAERRKTETGYMRVSSPEQTALDLLRYVYACGHLGNVATVLAELADRIDPTRLVKVASGTERADSQRLGYLLTTLGQREKADELHRWLEGRGMSRVPLRRGGERKASLLDDEWRVYVNAVVEPDA